MNLGVSIKELALKTWKEFGNDNVARLGAAFAYYTFTAFFPLVLVLVALVGAGSAMGFGAAEGAQQTVINAVTSNLPAARPLLEQSFGETERNAGAISFVGILIGLWTASNIFAQLEESFNVIFDVAPRKRSFMQKLKARAQAAGIILIIAALMIGSFVFSAVISTVQDFAAALPGGNTLAWLLNIFLSLALSSVVFAALFKYLPDKLVTWKAALLGGLFTALTWQVGRELLTWYLGTRNTADVGEVVGAVLGFLLLVYYASQIIMFGAQLTATYDELVNPDLVRGRTADDSALRGPGQGVVTESGEVVGGAGAVGQRAGQVVAAAKPRAAPFAVGFVTGVAALLLGVRALIGNLIERISSRGS